MPGSDLPGPKLATATMSMRFIGFASWPEQRSTGWGWLVRQPVGAVLHEARPGLGGVETGVRLNTEADCDVGHGPQMGFVVRGRFDEHRHRCELAFLLVN